MSEYVPTTDEVRDSYDYQYMLGMSETSRTHEFDRWLAEVKAAAWAEGFWAYEGPNPYREEKE